MKIAIDANVLAYPPTGVAKSLLCLMNSVAKIRPDWKFTLFSNNDLQTNFEFPTKRIKQRNNFLSRCYIASQLASHDIVHYHWNGGILPAARKCKNIVMIHDVLPLEIPNYFTQDAEREKYMADMKFTVQNAVAILTPSNYSREKIIEFFAPRCPIYVLPHGITLPARENAKTDDYYIYVGGYAPRKGLVPLLREFLNMPTPRKLRFVGTIGYFSDEFKSLAEQATKAGILTETGYVDEDTLADMIAHARGLIYPSQWEGFGLPPIEAMSVGTPAFVSRGTCIPEICGDAAIYFNPDKQGDLTDAINAFENASDDDKSKIIARGRDHATRF